MEMEPVQPPPGIPGVTAQAQDPLILPMSVNGSTQPEAAANISADEIALYDRQIRLWGMQAQQRIRSANVLLITLRALGAEIAKNLVLAGIGSLNIVDHEPVTAADLGAQFFLTSEDSGHLGANRAEASLPQVQRLNPRVTIAVDTADIRSKGPSFFAPFDIVIATDLDPSTLNVINTATRLHSRAFYAAGTHGLYGFIFADLIEHDYVITRDRSNMPTALGPESKTRAVVAVQQSGGGAATGTGTSGAPPPQQELVTKRELYSTWFLASDGSSLPPEIASSSRRRRAVSPALSCLRALWDFQTTHGRVPSTTSRDDLARFTILVTEKHRALGLPADTLKSDLLRSFMQNVGAEAAPVAAILGGQLAQDVINALGRSQQPIQNFVVFDGAAMEANMYPLHPEGPLGAELLETTSGGGAGMAEAATGAVANGVMGGNGGIEAAAFLGGMPAVDLPVIGDGGL